MKLRSLTAICIPLVLSTAACDKIAKKVTQKVSNEVAQEVSQAASLVSDAERATMGHYATGFNAMIGDPQDCLKEYFENVPQEGPEEGEKYRLFPRHTRGAIELKKAKTEFEQAAKGAPDELTHLEPLAKAAVGDLEKVVSTFEEAHKYYDAEDYKDDDGAKGKQLHDEITKLSESYRSNVDKLEAALSKIEERQAKEELEQFEKDKSYSYWFRFFNFEASQVLKASKPEAFSKAYSSLDKTYEGLTGFADGKGDKLHASFKAYVGQADRFHSTAKKLSRALGEAEADEREVSRLRSQLVSGYNALVSTGNSLRQLEANDLLK